MILFSVNVFAKNIFNLSYSTSAILFTYLPSERYDQQFRYDKSLGYHRYEISYQHCTELCFSYGLGQAIEEFTIAKYLETSPSYISYKISSTYTYVDFKLSRNFDKNLEALVYGNLGKESLSIEKYSGTPNGRATDSYIRIEFGCAARYYFAELPSIKIERIFLVGGASLYIKQISDVNFDNQVFTKFSLMGLNFLINAGIGISF